MAYDHRSHGTEAAVEKEAGVAQVPAHALHPPKQPQHLLRAAVATHWRAAVPALLLIGAPYCVEAQQLPVGGQAVTGGITMSNENEKTLHIEQRDARGEIEWASFGIGEEHRVRVAQPSADAILLNRVIGRAPSVLAGAIEANGTVLLVNPNGIDITPSGTIRAAGFVASTLDMNHDAIEGMFEQGTPADIERDVKSLIGRTRSLGGAGVTHRGSILLDDGGTAMLLGTTVNSSGPIIAQGGRIALAAGKRAVAPQSLRDPVCDPMRDPLRGPMSEAPVVRVRGIVQARSTGSHQGQILVLAEDQGASIHGLLDTGAAITPATDSAPGQGGLVMIQAARINVSDALINASGSQRGGEIYLTTGNTSPAGAYVDVGRSVRLFANAEGGGRGGKVTLASANGLHFNARVQANGGAPRLPGHFADTPVDVALSDDYSGGYITFACNGQMKLRGEVNASPVGVHPAGSLGINVSGVHIAAWDGVPNHSAFAHNVIDNKTLSATLQDTTVSIVSQGGSSGRCDASVHVDAPLHWTSSAGLILHSDKHIRIAARLRASGIASSVHLSTTPNQQYSFDGGAFSLPGSLSLVSIDGVPYKMIRNADQLRNQLSDGDGGFHALAGPIDLSSVAFQPIESRNRRYFSHFEGLGNTISALRVDSPTLPRVGLFATLGGNARVSNLVLSGADLRGAEDAGAVVGVMHGASRLESVRVIDATVRNHGAAQGEPLMSPSAAPPSVGGLVGAMEGLSALDRVTGSVNVSGRGNVGGLAGTSVGSSSISASSARGKVAGTASAGGVVGAIAQNAKISDVRWHGAVRGPSDQLDGEGAYGGVVGIQTGGHVEHAEARGSVTGVVNVGGVVGSTKGRSKVTHCAARNIVDATRYVGGLAGRVTAPAALVANDVLSSVTGNRDVGSLVGYFESGVVADNRTHGVVTQFGRAHATPIGRRGFATDARYVRGPYASLDEMILPGAGAPASDANSPPAAAAASAPF